MKSMQTRLVLMALATLSILKLYSSDDRFDKRENTWYQPADKVSSIESEIKYWEDKLTADYTQSTYYLQLGGLYNNLFRMAGDITALKQAEHLLHTGMGFAHIDRSAFQRNLAQTLISQHRFCEALNYALQAENRGDKLRNTEAILFDIYSELGDDGAAKHYLNKLSQQNDFTYKIRLAKWYDSVGELDQTILVMEELLNESTSHGQQVWLASNLGDYYGHAGRIEDSYAMYKETLMLDPSQWYALKGMAWIVFSHERDHEKAINLLNSIQSHYPQVDATWMLAEIYEDMGNIDKSNAYRSQFIDRVTTPEYDIMYVHYVAQVDIEHGDFEKALKRFQPEIEQRPTPENFALQALIYAKLGDQEMAQTIYKNSVAGQTGEPKALYHSFLAVRDNQLVAELKDASYELGPNCMRKLNQAI